MNFHFLVGTQVTLYSNFFLSCITLLNIVLSKVIVRSRRTRVSTKFSSLLGPLQRWMHGILVVLRTVIAVTQLGSHHPISMHIC